MKKLSSIKLSSFVFAIFMFLPMISILSRVIYVQSNPNAKESYYGETINEKQETLVNSNDLVIYNEYYFLCNISFDITYNYSSFIGVENVNVVNGSITTSGTPTFTFDEVNRLYLFIRSNNYQFIFTKNSNNLNNSYILIATNGSTSFTYNFLGYENSNDTLLKQYFNNNYIIEYNDYSYIDNVFDYSLSTFLEDSNNASINFFSFFDNVFLVQSGHNMLYINFLNWYMNYGLLVSCGYILFFILYFFINVVRKLVLSFTNKIEGGF